MKKTARKPWIEGGPVIVIVSRLLVVLLLMSISRMLLYIFNPLLFPGVTVSHFFWYLFTGMRFDLSALLYINLPFIVLMLLPFRFRFSRFYRRLTNLVFYFSNAVGLIPNFADSAYFPFSLKRLTGDIFNYVALGNDTARLMPRFMVDFWYVFVLYTLAVIIMIMVCRRFVLKGRSTVQGHGWYVIGQTIIAAIIGGIVVLGLRGGLQLKPIGIMEAGRYAPIQHTPLVLNSAFTILRTLDQENLEKKDYFRDDKEMNRLFNAEKHYARTDSTGKVLPMSHQNVVIIILESFSKEHFGSLNRTLENGRYQGFTPFLDSLISHSLVTDGYSDGKRSIEGIPAILASLPTWMTQDYITSVYGGNTINSLASLLKGEGYKTAFFHGGNNGTMGFDAFCGSAGFDAYYGRNEYANDKDYDGEWGIWDEPFLQFMASKLNTMEQPFMASVFTLSSHHPYQVPEKYKGKFRKGKLPIQQTVMYSDYALRRFFATAGKMPWFNNTLFVITADHTSESAEPFYQNRVGQYSIPVIFYSHDSTLILRRPVTAQQTDIMPSVLHYLGYSKPFVAFGNSVFDTTAIHAAVSSINGSYQLIQNGWALQWDGTDKTQLYHFESDSSLSVNQADKQPKKTNDMENLLKAYIQQYNNRLIDNRMIIK